MNPIVERIKKLLALASSPVEAEATAAYKKAQALIAQYSVDLSQENKVEEIQEIPYTLKIKESPGLRDELPWIAHAVVMPFGVYIIMNRTGIKFVGFKTNLIVAEHALDCILAQCAIDHKIGYRKERSITFSPMFWKGVRESLEKRFGPKESNEVGLVVYDPIRNYMNRFQGVGYHSKTASNTLSGREAGREAGTNAQIRPGVQTGNSGRLLC